MASDKAALPVLTLAHVFPRTLDDSMGAFLLHLSDALTERGIVVYVIAPHAAGLKDEETLSSVRVRRFHYAPQRWERLAYAGTMHESVLRGGIGNKFLFIAFALTFLLKTLGTIRSIKPRLIHAHWWMPDGLVGALASMIARVPLVVTTHGTDVELLRRRRWAKPLARWVFARASAVTCGSSYLRDQLLAMGVVNAVRVYVVPMPVNALFENVPDAREERKGVLTIARLTAQKNIDTLVAAIALLRDQDCAAQLTIIGDGPVRANLEQQMRALSLTERVRFLGQRAQKELPSHYARAAAFVLPSMREGMGLVLVEALLCGAPVIALDSGGVVDIVKNEETGLLVSMSDPGQFARAIERLLTDRALAERLAENGRASVQARYTRTPVAQQFADLYERVL